MSEAQRYRVRQSVVKDYVVMDGGRVEAATLREPQAERIARLLNAEEEVRAALMTVADRIEEVPAARRVMGLALSKVRAALSALDGEAVRP